MHPSKALEYILFTNDGIFIFISEVQPINEAYLIDLTVSDKIISFNCEKPLKNESPIDVAVEGIVI